MNKLPAVYIYKRTSDKGTELKYSMRSLYNIKNWDGRVFVAGDTEAWFGDKIVVIEDFVRSHEKHIDQQNKLRAVINDKRVPDDFIYLNDDMYATEKVEVKPLYDGKLEIIQSRNGWHLAKSKTKTYLEDEHDIPEPLNYELHVPIVFNKEKLSKVLDILDENPTVRMQPRSIYGNIYKIGGKQYKDRKTQTSRLLKGGLISTRTFTTELNAHYKTPSEFEK